MVRTKSSEAAKRLAAKVAAAGGKEPPHKPAKPKPSGLHFLGDPRPTDNPPTAEESAEDVARAEIIAQTRKGAMVAATLCRTNFTQGLQGTSQDVVDVLGEGGLVPRKGWLGGLVPDIVRESENARFEIKEPKLPRPLRTAAIKPAATEQDQDALEAPAPTLTAAPAASEGGGGGARLPPAAEEGAGDDEGRATADPAAPTASAPGSSADHAAPPLAPPPKGAPGGSGDEAAEEPQAEPQAEPCVVLPPDSLRSKWQCGGELGLCPGCVDCIEDHPDRPRTEDDGRPEALHSDPGNEAALTREPKRGPLHLAERVEVLGPLKVNTSFIGRRGYALEWHAEPGVYEVLFEGHGERMLVSPANLVRAHTMDYSGPFIFHRLPEDLNLKDVHEPSSNRKPMYWMLSMLASLVPVAEEQPAEEGTTRKEVDAEEWAQVPEDQPIADISLVDTSDENKLVWMKCLPMPIKRVASRLLDLGRLTWDDLLEDGLFFWEIGFTERPEWIEPDRWHQTVCNFLLLMAWERTIHPHCALYPTARLQMLRDLFYGEWAMRTHRLGLQLWPIYFKEEAEADAAAAAAGEPSQLSRVRALADDLSAYEHQRNANIAENQRRLRELFGADAPRLAKKSAPPRRAPPAAAPPAEPSRSSGRVQSQAPVSYMSKKRKRGGSDDGEADSSDDEVESGEEYEGSDAGSSDGDEPCTDDDDDDEGGAKAGGKAKARGGKAKAKPRTKAAKGGAAASSSDGGKARKKLVKSRGASASVAPGGDGFECPASGCKSVFDTAEEALEHGATHGLSGEREVDDEGKSCCLWQGCGKKIKVTKPSNPKPDFSTLRRHEAEHTKGPKPREGFVCPECDEAYPTSAAAWACAATHDVEEDPKKCLWAGCGLTFRDPSNYREHEPVHTGVWPYHCTTCNQGQRRAEWATLCCKVTAACKCGWSMKGTDGPRNFKKHKARCGRGAAPELLG